MLTTYGWPEDLLETLTQALDRFEALAAHKATSATSHVGASAELMSVTREVMQERRRIDALYRRRFRDNPELLAAWNSARNIPWKARPGKGGEAGERPAA